MSCFPGTSLHKDGSGRLYYTALQDLMRERGDRRSQAEMKGYVTREEQGPKEFPEHQLERMNGSTIRIQRKNRSN